jgi:hypothetical protein
MASRQGSKLHGWLDPADWKRHGRGRVWEFELPTERIVAALGSVAREHEDRFELLACFREEIGHHEWRSRYEPLPVEQLSLDGPWQYAVRSLSLTSELPEPEPLEGTGWPAVFAANGLLLLRHPDHARRNRPNMSSLGIVNRVECASTGDVIDHKGYDKLFADVKRALQR